MNKKPTQLKRYIVRKYIMAKSAQEALRRERVIRPDDVYVDETWKEKNQEQLESCIGFALPRAYEDDDDE